MIIYIKNVDDNILDNETNVIAIDNILKSFGEEKHIVLSNNYFFDIIIKDQSQKFSSTIKAYASEAKRSLFEYMTLLESISFHVELDFAYSAKEPKWDISNKSEKIIVGPEFFSDSNSVQRMSVICENQNDADFYNIVATFFKKEIKAGLCNIYYEAINGGGGTTKNVFDRTIQSGKLTLCILDNDKSHPRASLGGTSKIFGAKSHQKTGKIKIIDAHEVESLIPINTIEEVLRSNGINDIKLHSLNFIQELMKYDESVKFYFDHKNGIDLKLAFKLDYEYGNYWIPLLKKTKEALSCDCIKDGSCDCDPPCIRVEGYGSNILQNMLEHVSHGNLKRYSPPLSPKLKDQWMDLGNIFFSWCCAPIKKARM